MPIGKWIREPSEQESQAYENLRSKVLKYIYNRYPKSSPINPINICIYTAFPSHEWKFTENGELKTKDSSCLDKADNWQSSNIFHMSLWVWNSVNDGMLENFEITHEQKDLIRYLLTRWPRSITIASHWKKCPCYWQDVTDKTNQINFEFEYECCNLTIQEFFSSNEDFLREYAKKRGGLKPQRFYELINQLDDFVINQPNLKSLAFARIPYLSVPLSFIALPKESDAHKAHIIYSLHKLVRETHNLIAAYVTPTIQLVANNVASLNSNIELKSWLLNRNKLIVFIIGFAIASVLFPAEIKLYADDLDIPFLTIKLQKDIINYNNNLAFINDPASIDIIRHEHGFNGKIVITFLDHCNPYLQNSHKEILDTWVSNTGNISNKNLLSKCEEYYQEPFEVFEQIILSMIPNLISISEAKMNVYKKDKLDGLAKEIQRGIGQWQKRLSIVTNPDFQLSKIAFEYLKIFLENIGLSSPRELSSSFEYTFHALQKLPEVINELKISSETGIKHYIDKSKNRSDNLNELFRQFCDKACEDIQASNPAGYALTEEFTHCLESVKYDVSKDHSSTWPIMLPPENIEFGKHIIIEVFTKIFKSQGIKNQVEVKELMSVKWSYELVCLVFLCKVLFVGARNRNPKDDSHIEVSYTSNEWSISWIIDPLQTFEKFPVCLYKLIEKNKKETDRFKNSNFSVDKLTTRLLFLDECLDVSGVFKLIPDNKQLQDDKEKQYTEEISSLPDEYQVKLVVIFGKREYYELSNN
jgi:hypothetical protein